MCGSRKSCARSASITRASGAERTYTNAVSVELTTVSPVALDRTRPASQDLDWLPPSFKALRWTVAGTLWTGMASLIVAIFLVSRHGFIWVYAKGIALLFAGGLYAGDRAARAVVRRRLVALSHGDVALKRLGQEADGELVHVRGKVRAGQTLPSLFGSAPAVLRRVLVHFDGARWVNESGYDFWLVGDDGEDVLVEVSGARLIAAEPSLVKVVGDTLDAAYALTQDASLRLPPGDGNLKIHPRSPVTAGEVVVCDGDEVEVVGYKSRTVDLSIEARMERETPMRVTLRAGKEMPLLVAPTRRR